MARSAVTRANSAAPVPNVENGMAAGGGTVDAAAGAVTKHPATRTSSSAPMAALTTAVTELPTRKPIQWIPVKPASREIAAAREYTSAGGQRTPRNATTVTAL